MHNRNNLPHAFLTRHLHRLNSALVRESRCTVQRQRNNPQPTDAPQCPCLAHVQLQQRGTVLFTAVKLVTIEDPAM